jgi:DNA-binding CsgD family transcriptional regulator
MKMDPLGYVEKPFSPRQIEASIEMAMHWCNQQKEETKLREELELKLAGQANNLRKATLLMIPFGEIEELDASLKLLMDHLGEDRTKLEANVVSRLTELFGSLLDAFKNNGQGMQKQAVVKAVEAILIDVLRPFVHKLPLEYRDLTLTEFRIVHLLKEGKRSKEVAETLGLAPSTVVWHRKNIRKKLGITNTNKRIIDPLPTRE